ncbi:MAG TPA: DUF2203 domain-containing protein, partial [Verrucomicrobiae bacterium]|nr:DUF2203 domain-containing protein [Verrucomicrobiae bacterium]
MAFQFKKHYTREEAQSLLPQLRRWLQRLALLRGVLGGEDSRMKSLLAAGADVGGDRVNERLRGLVEVRELLQEFESREIQIKDLDRGLVDFPAVIGGREVFLCWERDEDVIEYWHDLDAGYAGRER